MHKLELTTRVIQKNLCAKLNCDVDSGNAVPLREALLALADQALATLFLDLSEVRKMDSAGIAVLVETHERLKRNNRRLALVHTPEAVHGMLELMGVFEMYSDLDAGLNAAAQKAKRLHDSTRLLG
ncbi:MAG: STAS domain-containing protein [Planctomycetes bacterium]|nr:STAS domain-containing protein [Planctomycetota bacterium]MCB9936399.1 STAS domain-containing protein [Planctomycetota bacterium]